MILKLIKLKVIQIKVKLDNNLMMELKYPSLDEFIKTTLISKMRMQMDQSFKLIASCIDKIYTDEEVWVAADCTKKEITEFLESMNSSQFKKIEEFFTTMPKLSHTIKVKIQRQRLKVKLCLRV